MITRKQLLSFWPDVLGVGALVLPFAGGISPLKYLLIGFTTVWEIWLLVVALLLAIHIAVWQALRLSRGIPTKTERVLAYGLSTGAILPPVIVSIFAAAQLVSGDWSSSPEGLSNFALTVVSVVTLITANVLLLRHNLKADLAEVSASVFLIGGYLPSGWITIWDIQTGTSLKHFYAHDGWVETIAVSPDGRGLVSGGPDGNVKYWSLIEILAD